MDAIQRLVGDTTNSQTLGTGPVKVEKRGRDWTTTTFPDSDTPFPDSETEIYLWVLRGKGGWRNR